MNIPRSIKAMPWPEAWKREGQQDVAVSLSWPVVDHEKLLVATFRRNRTKKCHGAPGADFRIVCSKKRNRAAVQYRDGSRPKRSDGLEQAAERMFVKIHTCYPEISTKDEAALGKWLGCQKSWNHMLPELAAWVECAMEQEEEERRKARGELEDEEVTKLCPDELPSGLVEFIQRRTLAEDRVLLYKKGNVIGTCYMCRKEVHATAEQNLAAMKVAQEEAQTIANREKQTLEEQVQTLQKKLAVASSSEMTIFKLHFEQGQASINKMTDCIRKMEEAGDRDGAGKLRNALSALLTTTLGILQ